MYYGNYDKDGKYLGVVGAYEFDDKKAKVGLRVTF